MLGFGFVLAVWTVMSSVALAGQSAGPEALLPVRCDPIESGRTYVHSATVPEYYLIEMGGDQMPLQLGPFTQFEVKNQDGKEAPDVKKSMSARVDRILFFYDERRPLPVTRGQQNSPPRSEVRRVYALTVYFKSSAYDLDWKDGGDYRYPDKEMVRNVFCSTSEIVQ